MSNVAGSSQQDVCIILFPTQNKEKTMSRRSSGEFQLRRIIVNMSSQHYCQDEQQSQFDDKIVSNTPSAQINYISKLMVSKQHQEEQLNLRRRKEQIQKRLAKQNRDQTSNRSFSPTFISIDKGSMEMKQKQKGLAAKANSQFFKVRNIPTSPTKREVSVSEVTQLPFSMTDYVQKKSMNIRSRSFKSASSRRQQSSSQSKGNKPSPSQCSLVLRGNPEHIVMDHLQPWRYDDDSVEQPIFIRKRLMFK